MADHPSETTAYGELAYLFRLTFASSMAACILLGFAAIRRGDISHHQAWIR